MLVFIDGLGHPFKVAAFMQLGSDCSIDHEIAERRCIM
jgi:hypothetical protein